MAFDYKKEYKEVLMSLLYIIVIKNPFRELSLKMVYYCTFFVF